MPIVRPRRPDERKTFSEFQRVATITAVQTDAGMLPIGSMGTIVDVCRHQGFFEVEFTKPFQIVATLHESQIE